MLVAKARSEADGITSAAHVAANQEMFKLREEAEQSAAGRRGELAEFERRLSEREALINSQLQRVVEAEKSVGEQKAVLRQRADALEQQRREVAELHRQGLEQLRKTAGFDRGGGPGDLSEEGRARIPP